MRKTKYKIIAVSGVLFIYLAYLWMCVLFYFSFVCLHVCAYACKSEVHCRSVLGPGASGLPYYCTPLVCVPDVIEGLAVWRQNNNKKNTKNTTITVTHWGAERRRAIAPTLPRAVRLPSRHEVIVTPIFFSFKLK